MELDTDVPASVAIHTQPQEGKPGLMLSWRFRGGGDYAVLVEEAKVTSWADGWSVETPDGRLVQIYSAHVLVFESRAMPIKAKRDAKEARSER